MPYKGIFNYAKINNTAVKAHGGDAKYLLFLNNDVEAIKPGWIQRLRSLAARPMLESPVLFCCIPTASCSTPAC